MAFNASVNLGTVGNGITGQTVSISGCTGASCGSGCTSLATSQAVTSFPKTLTGIPDNVVSLFVKVDGGDCSGTSQCISITGIPGATPTPTTTSTTVNPTITPTTTTTPTINPTITPTTTTTPTINPTITPTVTPTTCLSGDLTTTGTCSGSDLSTFTLASGYKVTVEPQGYFYSGTGTRYAYAYLRTSTGVDIQQFTLTQVNSNTPTFSPTGYTLTTPGTYQLYVQQIDCNQGGGTGGSGQMNLDVRNCETYIATPTPTITSTTTPPLYGYFRSTGLASTNLFCSNPGYVTTALWYSTGTTLSGAVAYTRAYEDTEYTPFNGGNLWYAVTSDDTFNTLTGGQFNAVQIDSDGYIISTSLVNCTGGGGGTGGLT